MGKMEPVKMIPCPTCRGTGREPSAITLVSKHCPDCGGGGYFTRGTPTRLMTLHEYVELRSRSTDGDTR